MFRCSVAGSGTYHQHNGSIIALSRLLGTIRFHQRLRLKSPQKHAVIGLASKSRSCGACTFRFVAPTRRPIFISQATLIFLAVFEL